MKDGALTYEKEIRDVMLRIGLFLEDFSFDDNLYDIFTNSLTFITFIIELEQKFEIEIPDEYLNPEQLKSIRHIDNILLDLILKREKQVFEKNKVWNLVKRFFEKWKKS